MIEVFPSEIIGESIKLVKLEPTIENLKIVFNIISDNREEFSPWLEWTAFVEKPEDEKSLLENDKISPEWFIQWNSKIVGRIGFVNLSRSDNRGEIGYWLDKKASGHGIMTTAFKIIEEKAFTKWGFNRIELKIDPENTKSLGVAHRMGFVQEGVLRGEHFINGKYKNSIIFSKLKSEYKIK